MPRGEQEGGRTSRPWSSLSDQVRAAAVETNLGQATGSPAVLLAGGGRGVGCGNQNTRKMRPREDPLLSAEEKKWVVQQVF